MENNRSCSMPLMPDKRNMYGALVLMLLSTVFLLILICITIGQVRDGAMLLQWLLGICISSLAVGMFLMYRFAQVHFVPDGVAVTLFGITLKRVPAEKIRLITAVHAVYRGTVMERIALCDYSLEELTAHAYASKPKLFRNSREFWTGEWADEYLTRRLIHGLKPDRRLFWLYWNPERLEALRSMYPQAQWMDLTKDKIFDKQLEDVSTGKSQQF